jgi:outer membrane lipoprotein SlyB
MTKTSTIIIFAAAAFAAVLTGCAPGLGGSSYSREQARREQRAFAK